MNAACADARRAILRGEAQRVAGHLAACEECRRVADADRHVADCVHRLAPRVEAPDALRVRIAAALERERSGRPRANTRRVLMVVGLVVFVGCVVVTGGLRWQRGASEARRTAAALVADHMEFAGRADRAEVSSASAGTVAIWLRQELGLPVVVPEIPSATILGGRRCRVRDRPAAVVFYRFESAAAGPEQIGTLFVFETDGEAWRRVGDELTRSTHACRTHDRGLAVIAREERGLTHAFVTEASDERLRAIADRL